MSANNEANFATNIKINANASPLPQSGSTAIATSHAISRSALLSSNSQTHSNHHLLPPHLSDDHKINNLTAINPNKWSCIHCTFLNDFYISHCSMCYAPKRTDSSSLKVIQESDDEKQSNTHCTEWQCSVCTLINKPNTLRCRICNELKSDVKTPPPTSVSDHSHHAISNNNTPTPFAEEWRCRHCSDMNDYDLSICMQCGEERDERMSGLCSDERDWICEGCNHMNDWGVTSKHDMPCCLQCGAPNLKLSNSSSNDSLPSLEHQTAPISCDFPALSDWECNECGIVNPYHNHNCFRCNNIDDINGWNSNGIQFRITDCDDDNTDNGRYKYNELSSDEQQCLVCGYCRRYCSINGGLFKQTVVWCFGCYLGVDWISVNVNSVMDYRFNGNIRTEEEYIYSWKVRLTTGIILIGLMNTATQNIDYAVHMNDSYCQFQSGDIVTIKYDKKRGVLEYGIGDKWYGIAFHRVKSKVYQLIINVNGVHKTPNVQLLHHHWTAQ